MMQRQPARSLERSWQRYKQIRTIAWPRQHERPRKHILSPQSINFAPSVNLGRRTSHSPARSLFNGIWAYCKLQWRCFFLLPNQKEYNKKFADYYNLRNPTSLTYKISILYKFDHSSDHLWDSYRIDCGALRFQVWVHIPVQCNIYI